MTQFSRANGHWKACIAAVDSTLIIMRTMTITRDILVTKLKSDMVAIGLHDDGMARPAGQNYGEFPLSLSVEFTPL